MCRFGWNKSRADSISLREGRQSGDVSTQKAPERVRFGVAQFGELPRRVDDGTVVLTQLRSVSSQRFDGRREPLLGQPFGHLVNSRDGCRGRAHSSEEAVRAIRRKLGYRRTAIPLSQKPQRLQCQGVVGLLAGSPTSTRQGEHPTGTSPTWSRIRAVGRPFRCLHQARLMQCRQGPTHRRRGRPQLLGKGRGRARAVLSQASSHPLRRLGGEFHNTIVS